MERKTGFPKELCTDEAVCFIADRHNVTPQQLLRYFLVEENSAKALVSANIPLEANEIEILKGLSDMAKD